MTQRFQGCSLLCFCLLLAGGCTTPPQEDRPLERDELRALLARAKNPRSLYLTVYEGPAGPEFENAHRVHMDQAAHEPFAGSGDQPCMITVRGGSSTPLTALLDPSTPESWTTVPMKKEIPLLPLGPPYYQVQSAHLGQTKGGFLAFASAIKINSVIVDSCLFSIRNNIGGLGPFARGIETPKIDMVLGHQFLQAFNFVRLNYPEQTVSFSTTRPFPEPGPTLLTKLPLHMIKGALGTEAVVRGEDTKILLDLAGNYSVAVSERMDEKNINVFLGDLALRRLSPWTFDHLGLTESRYPRLGWQVLRQFVITLDYQRDVIWLERP